MEENDIKIIKVKIKLLAPSKTSPTCIHIRLSSSTSVINLSSNCKPSNECLVIVVYELRRGLSVLLKLETLETAGALKRFASVART